MKQDPKKDPITDGSGYGKCWFCGGDLGWIGDFDLIDLCPQYEGEYSGVISEVECMRCGAEAQFMKKEKLTNE